MSGLRYLQPAHWSTPKGYSNGIMASGDSIWLAGQIGWDVGRKLAVGLPAQVEQTLLNIVTLLVEANASPQDLVRLTWYVVSIEDYAANLLDIGIAYKRVLGKHFPVMALVQVVRLVEQDALVEIEATAVRRSPPITHAR